MLFATFSPLILRATLTVNVASQQKSAPLRLCQTRIKLEIITGRQRLCDSVGGACCRPEVKTSLRNQEESSRQVLIFHFSHSCKEIFKTKSLVLIEIYVLFFFRYLFLRFLSSESAVNVFLSLVVFSLNRKRPEKRKRSPLCCCDRM